MTAKHPKQINKVARELMDCIKNDSFTRLADFEAQFIYETAEKENPKSECIQKKIKSTSPREPNTASSDESDDGEHPLIIFLDNTFVDEEPNVQVAPMAHPIESYSSSSPQLLEEQPRHLSDQ